MAKQRLSKALAEAGVASRRASEELIFAGKVSVNGEIVKIPQTPVDLSKDRIKVDGEEITGAESKVYYVLNKPPGFICSQERRHTEKLVLDLINDRSHRLFTLGRLDKETSGLIIATNDGEWAQSIIHPSAAIEKEYLAKTDAHLDDKQLKAISEGTLVEGIHVRPKRVVKVRKGTVKITVLEGKKHEVRLLLKAAGLKVLDLKRIRIGGLVLGKLPLGAYRQLSSDERDRIFHNG